MRTVWWWLASLVFFNLISSDAQHLQPIFVFVMLIIGIDSNRDKSESLLFFSMLWLTSLISSLGSRLNWFIGDPGILWRDSFSCIDTWWTDVYSKYNQLFLFQWHDIWLECSFYSSLLSPFTGRIIEVDSYIPHPCIFIMSLPLNIIASMNA
jgi:hypothetical protein